VTRCSAEGDDFFHESVKLSFMASFGGCVASQGFAWVGRFFPRYAYFGGVSVVGYFCVY
jgi:uncharacterized membrane protein